MCLFFFSLYSINVIIFFNFNSRKIKPQVGQIPSRRDSHMNVEEKQIDGQPCDISLVRNQRIRRRGRNGRKWERWIWTRMLLRETPVKSAILELECLSILIMNWISEIDRKREREAVFFVNDDSKISEGENFVFIISFMSLNSKERLLYIKLLLKKTVQTTNPTSTFLLSIFILIFSD